MSMDDNNGLYFFMEEKMEVDEATEDEIEGLAGVVGTIFAGSEHSWLLHAQHRKPNCLYLTWPQLLPNPQDGTP
jgi:hypothetical protein